LLEFKPLRKSVARIGPQDDAHQGPRHAGGPIFSLRKSGEEFQ
jgi:hypothetical protein